MFYTYLWLRENGTPYYVGKGSGDRAFNPNGHRVHKPLDDARIIVQEFETEDDAFFAEKFLIALYGRTDNATGCLSNLTDGGEDPPSGKGKKKNPESVKKTAEGNRGQKRTKEQRLRISEAHKGQVTWMTGKRHTESAKQKNREAHLGKTHIGIKHSHCNNGHEFTAENLYINPVTGSRACRICRTAWAVVSGEKRKQKVLAAKQQKKQN